MIKLNSRFLFTFFIFSQLTHFFFGFAQASADALLNRIELLVGDSETIELPESDEVHVSRRGVIDIFEIGQNRWVITGMKEGVVSLSIGEGQAHYIVMVKEAEDSKSLDKGLIPAWICKMKGIVCDQDAKIVQGVFENRGRFLQAKSWCLKNECRMMAVLSDAERFDWAKKIASWFDNKVQVEVSKSGIITFQSACDSAESFRTDSISEPLKANKINRTRKIVDPRRLLSERFAKELRGQVDPVDISVRCFNDDKSLIYRLETKIMRITRSELEALGFDHSLSLSASAPSLNLDSALATKLESLFGTKRIEIIGEPAFRLIAGHSVEAHTGGEVPSYPRELKHLSEFRPWKAYNLNLRAMVTPRSEKLVRLVYDLSLSGRDANTVGTQNVKGTLDIIPEIPVIVASLDVSSSNESQEKQPFLAGLPILGPLFRLQSSMTHTSRVFAWFKLSYDQASGIEELKTPWPKVIKPSNFE